MFLLPGSKSTNWNSRYQVVRNLQDHPFSHRELVCRPYIFCLLLKHILHGSLWREGQQCHPWTPGSLQPMICGHPKFNLSEIKILERAWVWNQKNLSLALYLTCYMNLGQVISNLWTFVSSTESPKVLKQGSAMVYACFRKIPPAAVWGMGWRGETRGSSEAAE